MRILLLSKYSPLAASTRLRTFQYIHHLNDHGIEVTVSSLTDTDYLRQLYTTGRRSLVGTARGYLQRLWTLLTARQYDLLWIEKELFPYLPGIVERICHRVGMPYAVDYDDAVFHNYDRNANAIIRKLLSRKIDVVMRNAELVIAGNRYLATRAHRAGAKRVEIMPTVVDLDRYKPVSSYTEMPFTIGWIGSPSTGSYLRLIEPVLKRLVDGERVRLLLVGSGPIELGVPAEIVDWSEDTEIEQIRRMSVGIMPLANTPWELGKCGYKLIQYMACGLPVIASPVGANNDIIEPEVHGYLAHSTEEWIAGIELLRDGPSVRKRMGEKGRLKVENEYSLQVSAPRMAELLRACIS